MHADGQGRGVVEGHDFRFGHREGPGDTVLVAPTLDPLDHVEELRRKSFMKRRIPTNWSTWDENEGRNSRVETRSAM